MYLGATANILGEEGRNHEENQTWEERSSVVRWTSQWIFPLFQVTSWELLCKAKYRNLPFPLCSSILVRADSDTFRFFFVFLSSCNRSENQGGLFFSNDKRSTSVVIKLYRLSFH